MKNEITNIYEEVTRIKEESAGLLGSSLIYSSLKNVEEAYRRLDSLMDGINYHNPQYKATIERVLGLSQEIEDFFIVRRPVLGYINHLNSTSKTVSPTLEAISGNLALDLTLNKRNNTCRLISRLFESGKDSKDNQEFWTNSMIYLGRGIKAEVSSNIDNTTLKKTLPEYNSISKHMDRSQLNPCMDMKELSEMINQAIPLEKDKYLTVDFEKKNQIAKKSIHNSSKDYSVIDLIDRALRDKVTGREEVQRVIRETYSREKGLTNEEAIKRIRSEIIQNVSKKDEKNFSRGKVLLRSIINN